MSADGDDIRIDEGICVVIGIKLRVPSTCFIDGDAGGPLDEIGSLLLCSCPEFCGTAEGIQKGSTMEEGRSSGYSALVGKKFDEDLRIRTPLSWRDLQNHIKPIMKITSTKKPTTPPMIGPMTVDLPLALLEPVEPLIIADVSVPELPEVDAGGLEIDAGGLEIDVGGLEIDAGVLEMDAGVLELDATDVVAGDEAALVVVDPVGTALNVTPCKKKSKERGVAKLDNWNVRRRGRAAHQHLEPW